MRTVFLYAHFDDGHELAVVLKVGIALALDIAFEQFAGYFGAATQFYVVFQPFGEVEVSADEAYEFVLSRSTSALRAAFSAISCSLSGLDCFLLSAIVRCIGGFIQ